MKQIESEPNLLRMMVLQDSEWLLLNKSAIWKSQNEHCKILFCFTVLVVKIENSSSFLCLVFDVGILCSNYLCTISYSSTQRRPLLFQKKRQQRFSELFHQVFDEVADPKIFGNQSLKHPSWSPFSVHAGLPGNFPKNCLQYTFCREPVSV